MANFILDELEQRRHLASKLLIGRVAVVADQAWIRAATRIESVILPFISYRTFTPDQRQEAFAWVAGPSGAELEAERG